MKNIFLFGVLIFQLCRLNAQDCKYKVNNVDKFTGKTELETKPLELKGKVKKDGGFNVKNVSMILKKQGDERIFTMSLTLFNAGPRFGGANNKLILLLDNKETVELPLRGMTSDQIKYDQFTNFDIDNNQFEVLRSHNILSVRVVAFLNPFDFDVEENVKTKDVFNCIK